MPLSKARDKIRKREERAIIRLEKVTITTAGIKPVQPNGLHKPEYDAGPYPSLSNLPDADGNAIPDYEH